MSNTRNVLIICATILVLALACLLGWSPNLNQTQAPAPIEEQVAAGMNHALAPTTEAPAAEAPASGTGNVNGSDNQNPVPFAQAPTCFSLEKGQTYQVPNNLTIAGDVAAEIAAGVFKDFYKNDIGEFTLIINQSGGPISVQTPPGWGAGCLQSTDLKTLVNGEFNNPNHTDFVSVRVVTFTGKFTYDEVWYYKENLPLK